MVDRVNTSNAHVRGPATTRRSPDIQADEARRLLDDPAFIRGFDAVREGLIHEIEHIKHDGQPETENYELELCRTLRTLKSVKRAIALGVQGQKLRLADYRSVEPTEED